MSEETEQHSSINLLLAEADALNAELGNSLDSSSDEYQTKLQTAIAKYEQCSDLVARASVLSPNESLDDLATPDMRCLIIPFRTAQLQMRVRSPDRKAVLRRSLALYQEFVKLCDAYDLVTPAQRAAADSAGTGAPVSALPSDPAARRTAKIAQFKAESELKSKINTLTASMNAAEEDIRSYHKATLRLAIMKTTQELEMIRLEQELLAKAPPVGEYPLPQGEEEDMRSRGTKNDGYSEKLDSIPSSIKGGALLSKDGKPLRPFTLVDKRQQVKDGVFRPGHSLPTMTIDEYLQEERRRGGIIEGGGEKSGEKPEVDEDDYEQADRETVKAREWDEFKEQNPRGSGNTLNRG